MNLHADAVGRRYAVRPGCRFLGYREVGLAVFAMNLRVLVVEPREIPPIEEFLLRFMAENICSTGQLASLLGIDRALVRDRLIELRRAEFIDVCSEDAEEGEVCSLTDRGTTAVQELRQNVMHEITLPNVVYHGLLRRPVDLGNRARRQYLRPKEAKEADLALIRAIPNRYPRPEEIDVARLDQILKAGTTKRTQRPGRDVVAIKGVLKGVSTLYEPGVMLEYETLDGEHERQVAFAIEGQLLEDYECAFAAARGPALLKDLLAPTEEPVEERIKRQASEEVIQRLGTFADAEALASEVAEARQQVEDAKEQLQETDRVDTREVQRERIQELEVELGQAERRLEAAEKERDARKVKFLWTPEIRDKLWEAIETATDRLLILSGWVSSEVLNEDMAAAFRSALERRVRIWIGYGFDKDNRRGQEQRANARWQEAERLMKQLHKEFPDTFTFRDIGYTHEKRLICDTRFTFGGSFNLLSFSGERRGRGRLRHEGADLIEDAKFCDELYERYLRLFFG